MLNKQLELTHEQTSPLFRLMWEYNPNEPERKSFENNICAFHIGNGFILSVAHNLRTEALLLKSIPEEIYIEEILPKLSPENHAIMNHAYKLDTETHKRYLNGSASHLFPNVISIFKELNFDTRWLRLMQRNICAPKLIIQFKNDLFYNNKNLTAQFNAINHFNEPTINRHTFLLDVELVEAFYSGDIALYKIINCDKEIINSIPALEMDFSVLPDNAENFYCLQSSPSSEIGRMLNQGKIEGYLEHFNVFVDRLGGNYTFEGLRYLLAGYFRFGSSGAPYIFYDAEKNMFKVNAIQSEACPIQLSIENKRDGNFQYVKALASPLHIIKDKLEKHLLKST